MDFILKNFGSIAFWFIAFVMSSFWGMRSWHLFGKRYLSVSNELGVVKEQLNIIRNRVKEEKYSEKVLEKELALISQEKKLMHLMNSEKKDFTCFFWKMYQFIFNFFGSLLGLYCFYILLFKRYAKISDAGFIFSTSDYILFFISLLAITGHLPQATYGFVTSVSQLINKTAEKIYN